MQNGHEFMLALGIMLLLGLLTSAIGKRTFLPRVTLLLLFGVVIGDSVLDLIPPIFTDQFDLIATITLGMVGFLLGGKLTLHRLRSSTGTIMWVSLTASIGTTLLVAAGLHLFGVQPDVAILLGCVAAATAPAAVYDVVDEARIKSPFSHLLLSVVAIDDAWALVLFSLGVAVVGTLNGAGHVDHALLGIVREIGGAVTLGLVLGLPAAYLTGRIKPGRPILTEALGIVFLCAGLALLLEVSLLISSMVMGMTITNFAHHHKRPFHAIEDIEWPLMVIFFVVAGASLELSALAAIGGVGMGYIVLRSIGKMAGAAVGCAMSGSDAGTRRWIGLAMLPQAGVAIGMALVASRLFPEHQQLLLSVVISTTIFFELIGPVFTRMALQRTAKPVSPVVADRQIG